MKRMGHIVLLALVIQITGVLGVCSPSQPEAAHDCCAPSETGVPISQPASAPDCCLVSAVREHGSVIPTKSESGNAALELTLAARHIAEPNFQVRFSAKAHIFAHPVSPPISPLKQSCLLLI